MRNTSLNHHAKSSYLHRFNLQPFVIETSHHINETCCYGIKHSGIRNILDVIRLAC